MGQSPPFTHDSSPTEMTLRYKLNSEQKKILLISTVALSLRLTLFLLVGPWKTDVLNSNILINDSFAYQRLAVNMLDHFVFSSSDNAPFQPDLFRTPIYPLFLGLLYSLFGTNPYIAILFQLIFSSLTCLFVYRLAKILFDEKVALIAGLLLAIEYSSIGLSNTLLTETVFTFLFIVHVYYLAIFLKYNNRIDLFMAALFLGISTLCRPVSVYFIIFLIPFFLIVSRENLRRQALNIIIFLSVFLVVISPWLVRNYMVSNKLMLSSIQRHVVEWNDMELIKPEEKTSSISVKIVSMENVIDSLLSDSKRLIYGTVRMYSTIGSNTYAQLLGQQSYMLQTEDYDKGIVSYIKLAIKHKSTLVIAIIVYGIGFLSCIYITACLGMYTAIIERRFMTGSLFFIIIVYFTLASAFFAYTERYRAPIIPYILILSSYGMSQIEKKLKIGIERKGRTSRNS